jgi:hypothetical protein
MGITYGGVGLDTVDPALAAWIAGNVPLERCVPFAGRAAPGSRRERWAFAGFRGLDQIEVGKLVWPAGADRFAVGWFIANATQFAAIGATGQLLPLILSEGERPGAQQIQTNLWFLSALPITFQSTLGQLWLLTLVDSRYWWREQAALITVTAGTTTWANLYTAIGAALAVTIAADVVPPAYLHPDGELTSNYDSLSQQLDAVAANCGSRVYRKLDGTVYSIGSATAVTLEAANLAAAAASGRQLLAGGDIAPPAVPGSVNVAFRRANAYTAESSYAPTSLRYAVAVTSATAGATGTNPVVAARLVHDNAVAHFTFATDASMPAAPDNATELTSLATQIATDYYGWAAAMPERVYGGLVPWVPGGFADGVEWTHRAGEMTTRIRRAPWNDLTEEMLHYGTYAWPARLTVRTANLATTVADPQGSQCGLTLNVDTANGLTLGVDTVAGSATIGDSTAAAKTYSSLTVGTLTVTGSSAHAGVESFTGGIKFPQGSATLGSGTTNNWNPGITNGVIDITPAGAATITGMVPQTSAPDGLLTWLFNDSTLPITLTSSDTGSSAGNQFMTAGGTPVTINPGQTVPVKYSSSASASLVFTPPAASAAALAFNDFSTTSGSPSITSAYATLASGSLPGAGKYHIWGVLKYQYSTAGSAPAVLGRLYDGSTSAAVGNSDPSYITGWQNSVGGTDFAQGYLEGGFVTVTGADSIALQAKNNQAATINVVWTDAELLYQQVG